ncbi:MAG TPA: hypothetical protein VMR70_05325 [Flavisolibacter sp.]|nr:hypothetical protein [Flavisolibacter sp.]
MKANPSYFWTFLFLLPFSLVACSQSSDTTQPVGTTQQHQFSFGEKKLTVTGTTYATGIPVQFLLLHSNETTAAEVAGKVSAELGIDFLRIENNNQRLIDFELQKTAFRFDPNRIFSTEGIVASLQKLSQYAESAFQTIFYFREFLLGLVNREKVIVAVHNNTDGAFSLLDYQKDETGLIHQNPALDPDDFFITTDSLIFSRLKEANFNVALEYRDALADDGSLSIYSSRNNLHYVNVEAEHGHAKQQEEMLRALVKLLYTPASAPQKDQ